MLMNAETNKPDDSSEESEEPEDNKEDNNKPIDLEAERIKNYKALSIENSYLMSIKSYAYSLFDIENQAQNFIKHLKELEKEMKNQLKAMSEPLNDPCPQYNC